MTMSGRFWRWRMKGAALHFARRLPDLSDYDGVLLSGLMSLADLKALAPGPFPPAAVYFHENQLTYPLSEGETRDAALAWTNVTTALCADRVLFNSRFHRSVFLEALPGLVRLMPDYRPGWVTESIRARSSVLYPGCRFPARAGNRSRAGGESPLIVWNHRWEYDKAPAVFFDALETLAEGGLDFRLALLGERYRNVPDAFAKALERHGERIVQYGFVPSKADYFDWLRRGTVVVSTAIQENFGIAVIEAVRSGCIPVLPRRLSYPELVPPEYHDVCLYDDPDDLVQKLSRVLSAPARFESVRTGLGRAVERFSWEHRIGAFDDLLDELAADARGRGSV